MQKQGGKEQVQKDYWGSNRRNYRVAFMYIRSGCHSLFSFSLTLLCYVMAMDRQEPIRRKDKEHSRFPNNRRPAQIHTPIIGLYHFLEEMSIEKYLIFPVFRRFGSKCTIAEG